MGQSDFNFIPVQCCGSVQKMDGHGLVFRVTFRWLLLCFKREFSAEDSLRCFEILSSHHLELSSLEAQKAWDQGCRKDFAQLGQELGVILVLLF